MEALDPSSRVPGVLHARGSCPGSKHDAKKQPGSIMFKKIRWLIIYSFRGCSRVSYAILGLAFAFTVPVFAQSMDYPVGPGDILHISVWGDETISGTTTVGPDGTIVLPPPIGSVYVNQMTADQITEELTKRLEEYVKQPIVSVSIRSFQGFIVHILGQVRVPSFYRIPEGTSLQEVLTQAGGLTELADPDSIVLIRKGDEGVERQVIDFSLFLEHSEMESNPILQTEDVVVVPRISKDERMSRLVTVAGQVTKPGSYELEESVSLMDVLTLAGGIAPGADLNNIIIFEGSRKGRDVYRRIDMGVILSEAGDPSVQMPMVSTGEIVFVPDTRLLEEQPTSVNVTGQVVKPGAYVITEGMRLMDAIFTAGGFAEGAAIDGIAVIHEEQSNAAVSQYSLRRYFTDGDLDANPVLENRDTIIVPTLETARTVSTVQMAFSPSVSVSVIGEVTKPGIYQMPASSNLLAALTLAGGPTKDADLERTMVISGGNEDMEQRVLIDLEEVVVEGKLELLPVLSSGDIVLIPKEKEKRELWSSIVTLARDMTVIVVLAYYVTRISWD